MKNELSQQYKKTCDFLNFCKMDLRDLPIHEIINERFVRSFRVSLSNKLRMLTNVKETFYGVKRFEEIIGETNNPSIMCIFRLESLKAASMVIISPELAFGMIDTLFGGVGKEFDVSRKEFSQIDLTVLREIFNLFLEDINNAWSPVHEMKATYVRLEINPSFIGIIPATDK